MKQDLLLSLFSGKKMGWMTGLEPATFWATSIRSMFNYF